jgi:hypothetical protein
MEAGQCMQLAGQLQVMRAPFALMTPWLLDSVQSSGLRYVAVVVVALGAARLFIGSRIVCAVALPNLAAATDGRFTRPAMWSPEVLS